MLLDSTAARKLDAHVIVVSMVGFSRVSQWVTRSSPTESGNLNGDGCCSVNPDLIKSQHASIKVVSA